MASKKPPTVAIALTAQSPRVSSLGDLLSSSEALLEMLDAADLIAAPATPDEQLIAFAARETGISDEQALRSYRIISAFGESTTN